LILKVAVATIFAFMVMVQGPVPLHDPVQPAKKDPFAGTAVSLTCVPDPNIALHVEGQLMPAGVLVTVPVPLPASITVN